MSDAFGADDTASGGLQSDMPEIGAAPPSPRRTPSPLDAIARSIFGGQGAPRSAQPGPSPFQFPGRSQIPQGPQGQLNQRRWIGTTASLALPRGSPQPPLNFSPYQKSIPTRSPEEWGQPEEYARLPASFEVMPVMQGASQFFSQNGSQLSIPIALAMGRNAGAFIDGMMKGKEFAAKMARQELLDNALKLQMQEEDHHRRYGDTFARYLAVNETNDPSKLAKGINGVSIHDALWNDAVEMHDDNMAALIQSGASIADIQRYQALRDANLNDLQKANTKAAEQTEDDSKWTGGATDAKEPLSVAPPLTMGVGAAAAAAQSPLTGGAPPSPGGVAPAAAPAPTLLDEEGKPLPPPTPEEAAVSTAVKTGVPPSAEMAKMYPNEYRKILLKSNQNLANLRNIADSGSSVSPEQAKKLIAQVDPSVLNDAQRIATYQDPLGGGQGGQGASPGSKSGQYSDLLAALAVKLNPKWNQANYQLQRDFKKDNAVQNALVRTNSMPVTGQQLLDDLDMWEQKHPEDKGGVNMKLVMARALQNDPIAVKMMGDYKLYSTDLQQTLANGKALQGETFDLESLPSGWASIESWRAVIKGHATGARSISDGVIRRWQGIGGEGLPETLDPEKLAHLTAIEKLYPPTGAMPGEHVPFLNKRTGKVDDLIYTGVNTNNWMDPANFIDPKDYHPRTPSWKRPTYDPNQ